MNREYKTLPFSIKAIDDAQGLIEAYGSVFDVVDQGDDVVRPGAFKRTIQNSKARKEAGKAKFLATMLYQHDTDRPIGGWYDLEEDSKGLKCKGQIVLTTQLGRETYELIKAGVINEFSIGYDIPSGGSSFDKSTGNRLLKELRLWEISPVTFAMNQDALLTSVKSKKAMTLNQEHKDFNDHYQTECIQDWMYSDFRNLTCALQASLMDIFAIGDEPQSDVVTTILDDGNGNGFIAALKAYVQKGKDLNVSEYLSEQQNNNSQYSYMSNGKLNMDTKAGRAISAATAATLQTHIDALHGLADEHKKAMNEHVKAMHSVADDLSTVLQGSESAYSTDPGTPEGSNGKAASYNATRGALANSLDQSTLLEEQEIDKAFSALRSLHS